MERNGDGAQWEGGTSKRVTYISIENQGVGINGRAGNGAAELARRSGQLALPAESRADVRNHGF